MKSNQIYHLIKTFIKINTDLAEHLHKRKSKQQKDFRKVIFQITTKGIYNYKVKQKIFPYLISHQKNESQYQTLKNTKKESELEIDEEPDATKTAIGNSRLKPEEETNDTFN